ncbi:MAG: 3-hydroxyacyl-CoA dehydrogenase NAD-binding domain-containing protein [Microbacterium sp.]|uniref:3-hydroxyacyl-CoA dehydrogenase NAD-binding domain-containing protein n=1 Tax=Microbacterium sp. TaxID=51671 RepID=UPI0039E4A1D7
MPQSPVHSEIRDGVALITLAHPPVNTLSRPVRRTLLAALEDAEHDDAVRAVVLTGARMFSAGADLAEFDSGEGLAEPTLHLTIAGFLDEMSKPSVAAIAAVALGGGLELALACSARVAAPGARLGLPETTLGFMPGAGGTQRLPRAIGIERALDLIVTGRAISGVEAKDAGLVDAVADDPIGEAVRIAAETASGRRTRRRLRDEPIAEPLAAALIDSARRTVARSRTASAGVRAALEALQAAVSAPFDEGLATELRLFIDLAGQPEARAARYRFLSERSARRADAADALPVTTAAVIGAGTMGRGIALALLHAGIPTALVDTTAEAVAAAREQMARQLERAVSRGRVSEQQMHDRLAQLRTATDIAAVAEADLVIEAVYENLAVKLDVFAAIDAHARAGAILASNTSSLDLDVLAAATSRPADVVGMHFFSPADVMRLVEVVQGRLTSPAALATAVATAKRLGKLAVVAQVGPGFIGNRIFDAYLRQANLLLGMGVRPERIDRALEAWGMAMGPFRVLDLVGNDVPWQARQGAPADPAWRWADAVVERGWYGRKTGRGWYTYSEDAAVPTPELADVLPAATAGIDDDEIVQRCVLAMVNEAAAVLEEGIAADPADVDTVMVHGYGFPAHRGGPWFWAGLRGMDRVVRQMRRWTADDPSWQPHPALYAAEAVNA